MKKINFWNRDLISPIFKRITKRLNTSAEWFSNIWNTLFPTASSTGISTANTTTNRITTRRGTKTTVNLRYPETVNYDLAMDLYYNRKAGYKFGAFFCYSIIAIPLTFMGFPHFDVKNWNEVNNSKWWKERFEFYNDNYIMTKQGIQKLSHITGTVGIYPWFDSKAGYVKLYFIKNKYITDIYTNPDTQELTGLRTEIYYMFTWKDGKDYNFSEVKTYTKSKITTVRTGSYPPEIRKSETKRNPLGKLPVIFTNDKEPGEFEGHSDFERITPIVKAYSEVNLTAHEEVANQRAKLIQQVNDKDAWLKANGYDNIEDVSIEDVDFILNKEGEETDIKVPENLVDNHVKLMNLDYWNLSQTSRIPEIFWGLQATGNHASAGRQDKYGLAFVKSKQQQADQPYKELAEDIMILDAMAYNQTVPENIICTWDDFDSMTETEKAEVFDKWSSGIQKLVDSHAIDLQGVHEMLRELTKNKIEEDYEIFKKQIAEYGTLRSMLEQEYGGMRDFQRGDNGDGNGNGNGKGDNEELIKEIEKVIRNRRVKV
jgi:hypothetical protein